MLKKPLEKLYHGFHSLLKCNLLFCCEYTAPVVDVVESSPRVVMALLAVFVAIGSSAVA